MRHILSTILLFIVIPSFAQTQTFYDFTANDIDGHKVSMSQFKGKKVLVVNVASECGNTPQYKQLQELYEKYGDEKFTIIGFPANNFGAQEPGSNLEIKEFCTKNYGVTFPMAEKVSVKGDDIHPLYKWLVEQSANLAKNETDEAKKKYLENPVTWNFTKFLLNEKGELIAVFHNKTKVTSEEVIKYFL